MDISLGSQVGVERGQSVPPAAASVALGRVFPADNEKVEVAQRPVEQRPQQAPVDEVGAESLKAAVSTVDSYLKLASTDLKLQVDDEAGGVTVVSVLDKEDGKVIRQYPTDEMLELAKRITEQMNEFREALTTGGSTVSQGVFTNTVA